MKITYDAEADALYIELRSSAQVCGSDDIEEGVVADFDAEGHIVGLEVLDASDRLTADDMASLSFENLVTEKLQVLTLG